MLSVPKSRVATTKSSVRVANQPNGNNFQAAGQTDIGLMRQFNEDAYFMDDQAGHFAVADGLGGLPEGAMASRLTIEELSARLPGLTPTEVELKKLFNDINHKIWAAGREIHAELGIGTTLTLCTVRKERLIITHVGDCAVFLFRGARCTQLTTDHTMEEEFLAQHRGEYVFVPEHFAHTLTRCIGQPGDVECEVTQHTLATGDRVLICSDGVTKVITDEELLFLVLESDNPKDYLNTIIQLANKRGGPDNVTGIALFFGKLASTKSE